MLHRQNEEFLNLESFIKKFNKKKLFTCKSFRSTRKEMVGEESSRRTNVDSTEQIQYNLPGQIME